jgi:hypothetical protein
VSVTDSRASRFGRAEQSRAEQSRAERAQPERLDRPMRAPENHPQAQDASTLRWRHEDGQGAKIRALHPRPMLLLGARSAALDAEPAGCSSCCCCTSC